MAAAAQLPGEPHARGGRGAQILRPGRRKADQTGFYTDRVLPRATDVITAANGSAGILFLLAWGRHPAVDRAQAPGHPRPTTPRPTPTWPPRPRSLRPRTRHRPPPDPPADPGGGPGHRGSHR